MRICLVSIVLILFLTSSCTHVFFQPDHKTHIEPSRFGLQVEEIRFNSLDGTKLSGWKLLSAHAALDRNGLNGVIVQFHGNAENLTSHFASLAWLAHHRYALFTFDYRGYGKSEGRSSISGVLQDGEAAIQEAIRWQRQLYLEDKPLIIYAQSLGGAIAAKVIGKWDHVRQKKINRLVLDSTFCSYRDMAHEKLKVSWLGQILRLFVPLLISEEGSCELEIKNLAIPVLVIHDQRDPVVGYQNGLKIFESIHESNSVPVGASKMFWSLNQGYHTGAFADPSNRARFLKWLVAQ